MTNKTKTKTNKKAMKIEKRDIYSFLIAVVVVTITSIVQIENPIPKEAGSPDSIHTSASNNNLAAVRIK